MLDLLPDADGEVVAVAGLVTLVVDVSDEDTVLDVLGLPLGLAELDTLLVDEDVARGDRDTEADAVTVFVAIADAVVLLVPRGVCVLEADCNDVLVDDMVNDEVGVVVPDFETEGDPVLVRLPAGDFVDVVD